MNDVREATKDDLQELATFAMSRKYILSIAKDVKIDDRKSIYYVQKNGLTVAYVIFNLQRDTEVRRRHTATFQIVVDASKSEPTIISDLLEPVYNKAERMEIKKIYTYEVSRNEHVVDGLLNLGFTKEANIEKMAMFDGNYCDVFILSKFIGDWVC